ncbi:MAG: hypothetical protein H7308_19175 [Chthonomonadaceae bacterium]|nr:hypothetical protein [Chthonomonadaceae bacterium]
MERIYCVSLPYIKTTKPRFLQVGGSLVSLLVLGSLYLALLPPFANAQTQSSSLKTVPSFSSPGIFVAVGYGGRRKSSEDGIRWQNDTKWAADGDDDDNCLFSIVFAQGKFVAVGGGASKSHVVVRQQNKVIAL